MVRKNIWTSGDALPTFANHLVSGSPTLTPALENDWLQLVFSRPTGSAYHYVDMTSVSDYVIQAGDYLEYDVCWETPGAILIGMDFTLTDANEFRDSGAVDQNSVSVHPSTDMSTYATGKWYHRKIPFTAFTGGSSVGKTVSYFDVVCEFDGNNTTKVGRLRNIAITDGNGYTNIKKAAGTLPTVINKIADIPQTPAQELYKSPLFADANLKSYHRMEGNSNDSKGANNGTDTSMSYGAAYGKFGQGASFSGSGLINIGNGADLQITGALSICAWIKTNATVAAPRGIVGKMGTGSGTYGYTMRMYAGTACAEIGVSNNGSAYTYVFGTTAINDNNWHFIVGTYTPSTTLRIYVDGVWQASNNTSIPASIYNTASNVVIGATYTNLNEPFIGSMDDVAIYNKALTNAEIKSLYWTQIKKFMGISNV